MLRKIRSGITSWIISQLAGSEIFRSMITALCREYYANESLKQVRIWGDPSRLQTGAHVHLNNAVINTVSGKIIIGDYTFLGHSVSILTGTHDCCKTDLERQTAVPDSGRDVIIGKGVWIASNVTIIGPCRIGDYAALGVGAVVNSDVEPCSFYAGVPARFIKKL